MSHVALKDSDVYPLFKQMGGEAVPQGMDRKLLGNAGFLDCSG